MGFALSGVKVLATSAVLGLIAAMHKENMPTQL